MHAKHHRYTVVGHVADTYHRINLCGTSRHLVVRQQNRVIADSTRRTTLSEP